MPDDILDMIGTAALLEQLAEESAELAQAALKMVRKLCISILPAALNDPVEVGKTMTAKHRRWNERLHDEKLWEGEQL